MHANPIPQNLQELQQKVAFAENVKPITDQIHAANNLDHILLDLRKEILSIFDAEDLTIFAFDSAKKKIYPRFLISTASKKSAFPSPNKAGLGSAKLSPPSEHCRRL